MYTAASWEGTTASFSHPTTIGRQSSPRPTIKSNTGSWASPVQASVLDLLMHVYFLLSYISLDAIGKYLVTFRSEQDARFQVLASAITGDDRVWWPFLPTSTSGAGGWSCYVLT